MFEAIGELKRERMVKRLKIWVEREKRTSVQRVEKILFLGSVSFIPVGKMTIFLGRDAVHGSFLAKSVRM